MTLRILRIFAKSVLPCEYYEKESGARGQESGSLYLYAA